LNLKRLTDTYQVATCKNCGAKKLAYKVCPACGYYKGKQVITIKAKGNEKVIDA
jgi:large subunit ribosomal protein L32